MSYRIPKLGDDGKVAAEHIPAPAAIGAATPADLSSGLATKVNTSTYTAGLAGKQDVASLASDVASHVADGSALATALGAALVPGSVYENDRTTVSQTKRLHVVLTADGTDIDDLIIETVA